MIKKYLLFILGFSLFLFILPGCVDQKQKEEAVLRQRIIVFLNDYKSAVNQQDKIKLSDLFSEQFNCYGQNRSSYVQELLQQTFLIDRIDFSDLQVEDYKIFSRVKIKGSLIFQPKVQVTLFKELPVLRGTFTNSAVFVFTYEGENLKLLALDQEALEKEFSWGKILPELSALSLSQSEAKPGDQLTVNFQASKGAGNDLIFVYVNDYLLSGYSSTGQEPTNEESFRVSVPADFPAGRNFEVMVLALAGRLNMDRPQAGELQGVLARAVSVPIR